MPSMAKRSKEPKALRHLRETLTDVDAVQAFTETKGRPPSSGTELEIFVDVYTREMYNAGYDEWPRRRRPEQ